MRQPGGRGQTQTRSSVSPPAKRVTIREVADAAGVSPAAVSYALRGIQVSEETQERVREVASDLGYEANPIARALASGRTGRSASRALARGSVAAAPGRCGGTGLLAKIIRADPRRRRRPDRERALGTQLRDQQVDGLILSPVDPSDDFWSELAESLPIVSIGDALPAAEPPARCCSTTGRGGQRARALHALGTGGSRCSAPPGSRPTTPGRGLRRAPGRPARTRRQLVSTPYAPRGHRCRPRRADRRRPAHRRVLPLGLDRLRRLRRRPAAAAEDPPDLSVLGYDDHPVSILLPSLT